MCMNATADPLIDAQATIRLLQEELAATNHEVLLLTLDLERRVEQRTEQLESTNRELEAFSYSVSHDLRAPLRHVEGFSEMLVKHAGSSLDARGLELINRIKAATTKMSDMVESLLKFSHTSRTDLRKISVDQNELVREVMRALEPDTVGRDIDWEIGPLPSLFADRTLLSQVWTNLISNAIKYTRQRSPARIEIGQSTPELGTIVLFVRDNGVGFEMNAADKLFGVFQRLHTDREFEGTGIGLANVRRIISRHGGRVWAEAKRDVGATFYFTLPDPS